MPQVSGSGGSGRCCRAKCSERAFVAQRTRICSRGVYPFRPMRIAFLGTGSAFALASYNGAGGVDGRLPPDAGAPLLPHMHRLGSDPGGIEVVFLTHFHGDHVLGLPPFLIYLAFFPTQALVIVGPPDVERRLDELLRLAWAQAWPRHANAVYLTSHEAATSSDVAGV